jgi:hypothetical protein
MALASAATPRREAALDDLGGLTLRAVVLAVILTVAIFIGITRAGFIQINWVPYVVPPVPALLFLLVLQGGNAILSRSGLRRVLPSWLQPLSRGELVMIYAGMSVALCMERAGYVMHYLLSAQYFATDVNQWQRLFDLYPDYYIPHDARIVNQWFEAAPSGRIPWAAWAPFLGWWGGFSLLVVAAMMSLAGLFRKQWAESERLTYPLLFLPIEITGGLGAADYAKGFFRNPLMWIGFALAAFYNVWNICHAFFPTIPKIEGVLYIDQGFNDPPWRYLRPLGLTMSLEVWGLAYLVSGEVLLSTWASHFLVKFVKAVGLSMGYRASGFPFYMEMSAGACITVASYLIWVARPHLRQVWQAVVEGPGPRDARESLPYRWLVITFGAATLGMVWMLAAAGQPLTLILCFFASLYMFVLVASRVRAEVGPPVTWNVPYGFDTVVPTDFLGTRAMLRLAGQKGLVLYYALFYVGRTVFAHTTAQAFTDGLKLADHGHVRRRSINAIMLIACLAGLAMAFWFHLDVGYHYGQGMIGAKVGRAGTGWAFSWSTGNYTLLQRALEKPTGPDLTKLAFYGAGALFTGVVTIARSRLTSFPFHPLGFILATLYGDFSPYWWPFFVAWAAQRLALRYGSLPLYRRTVPVFLGLTLGHTIVGGIVWRIIINYFIDPVISYRYYLNLGG